jgi:hypothetical protein
MENVISEVSKEIEFIYEIKTLIINDEKYCGIPWIKLYFKGTYFGFYGLAETKKIWIGQTLPVQKQLASLEIFEIDYIDKYKSQVTIGYNKILNSIDAKNNK